MRSKNVALLLSLAVALPTHADVFALRFDGGRAIFTGGVDASDPANPFFKAEYIQDRNHYFVGPFAYGDFPFEETTAAVQTNGYLVTYSVSGGADLLGPDAEGVSADSVNFSLSSVFPDFLKFVTGIGHRNYLVNSATDDFTLDFLWYRVPYYLGPESGWSNSVYVTSVEAFTDYSIAEPEAASLIFLGVVGLAAWRRKRSQA